MSRVICVLVVVLMSAISTVGVCDLTPVELGQQDAQRNVYRPKWFFAGCLSGTFFTWLFDGNQVARDARKPPEVVVVNVPNLLGKPPEYIEKYVSAYQAESIHLRSRWADYGWLTGAGLTTAFLVGYMIGRF